MLIKAVTTFSIENMGKSPLELKAGEWADLRLDAANQAILQGVAVPTSYEEIAASKVELVMEQVISEVPAAAEEAPKNQKKSKFYNANSARE